MNEELKVIISAEIDKLKSGVKQAKKSISDFTKKAAENIKKFSDEFNKVGDVSKKALKVVGGAIAGAATALFALTASTKDYRVAQAKLITAFETAGSSAKQAKQTYNDLYRVLGDSDVAVEAANHLSQLTTNQQDLSEWTNICKGVYATFGDSLPIEGLTEAANETAKTGALTGVLADALNWAGVSEDAFQAKLDACNTEAEREALIRGTLNGLYSDAAAGYEKNAAAILAQNEAQAKLDASMARIGEALQPIQTALTNLAADILTQLTPYIEKFAAEYLPQIIEALSGVGEKIGIVIMWIADNWDLIVSIGGTVLTIIATLAALAQIVSVVSAVLTIATSPISLVVIGIAALIAIIIVCITQWDKIKEKVSEVVVNIKDWVLDMVEKVVKWFGDMKDKIGEAIQNAKDAVEEKFEAIKTAISDKVSAAKEVVSNKFGEIKRSVVGIVNNVKQTVSNKFQEIKQAISDKITAAKETATQLFETIKTTISGKVSALKSSVSGFFEGIKSAITGKITSAKESALSLFETIKSGISGKITTLKSSISTTFESIKSAITDKITTAKETVLSIFERIKSGISDKLGAARDTVSSVIEKIKGFFNFDWSLPKLKMPHVSISGSFSLVPPRVPKFSVEWYARGGVFDKPNLFGYGNGNIGGLGEDGAEAIVPLEKNTQWLDKIAERLAAKQGNIPIVLNVDGKTFAQTSIRAINDLTAQTGNLGINLV